MGQIRQVVLEGYDKDISDKLLVVECHNPPEEEIDTVCFSNYNITVNREELLNVIEFLRTHQ